MTGISRFAVWYVGVQIVRPFAVALLLAATVANAQPHLVFDHKIGTDWPLNSNRWMSFVAISSVSEMPYRACGATGAIEKLLFRPRIGELIGPCASWAKHLP